MRALLLSAGFGRRLQPITNTIPKCLVPIHGVPLLEIWLSRIFNSDVERAVINLHYLSVPVRRFIENCTWRAQIDLFDEPVLLGTGGTLCATRKLLGDKPFLVIHSDNLSNIDLKKFGSAHLNRPSHCIMTMALFNTDAPNSCGIVELDAQKRVIAMHEKVESPPGKLANAAIYIMEPEVLDFTQKIKTKYIDISTNVIPDLIGRIYSYQINGYHRDIGSPSALEQAHLDIMAPQILDFIASNEEGPYGKISTRW